MAPRHRFTFQCIPSGILLRGLHRPAPGMYGSMKTGFTVAVVMWLSADIGPCLPIPGGSGFPVAGRMIAGVTSGSPVVGEELSLIKI